MPARQSWADLCRVVAIFGVILIHACGEKFYQFGVIPMNDWLEVNFIDSLVRCSVPLFVMLSGALLLSGNDKDYTIFQIAKRVGKVAIPLVMWSMVYLLYVRNYTGGPLNLMSIFEVPAMYHLWFVYMIIGIYLLLPVLQLVFRALVARKDFRNYFFAGWFLIHSVSIYFPMPLFSLLQQTSLFGYGGYFLLGGLLVAAKERQVSLLWPTIVYSSGVMVTFGLTLYFSKKAGTAVEIAYVYFSPNVVFASIAAFVLLLAVELHGRMAVLAMWVSDHIFLIFFMHVVVLERVQRMIAPFPHDLGGMVEIIAEAGLTFLLCLLIASVLRLLPKSRVILG